MAEATTHILRASLVDDKAVYRDIEVPSTASLYDLAAAIVGAFDFDFDHCFGFYSGLTRSAGMRKQPMYELFADIGEETEAMSVEKTAVAAAFVKPRQKMMFLFDYGDEWLFLVQLLSIGKKVPRARYPKIVSRAGKAPLQYPPLEEEDEDARDG